MFRDRAVIKGRVSAMVLGPDGELKKRTELTIRQFFIALWAAKWRIHSLIKMLKYEYSVNHNIVTDQGDALIADMLSTGDRDPVNNANGEIAVGTGWTGSGTKSNTTVNTATGSPKGLSATYPKAKGAWEAADDNVVQYRVLFSAGDLNDNGIDEAALGNGTDNLAYGQITPSVNVSSLDTLQIDWEITFLGA